MGRRVLRRECGIEGKETAGVQWYIEDFLPLNSAIVAKNTHPTIAKKKLWCLATPKPQFVFEKRVENELREAKYMGRDKLDPLRNSLYQDRSITHCCQTKHRYEKPPDCIICYGAMPPIGVVVGVVSEELGV